jgi:hypothetical protein
MKRVIVIVVVEKDSPVSRLIIDKFAYIKETG